MLNGLHPEAILGCPMFKRCCAVKSPGKLSVAGPKVGARARLSLSSPLSPEQEMLQAYFGEHLVSYYGRLVHRVQMHQSPGQ
mmetsp:Transcript_45792/g.75770  ORF Transcript_45792/g.75770 Transcript_45792/m.75770 type:complete len:82 (+) Transcript_45792:59-304(+)